MAQKFTKESFTKENMYDWVISQDDVLKLKTLDAKISALIKEKSALLKKASAEYKNKDKFKRTPQANKRFTTGSFSTAQAWFKRTPKANKKFTR